MGLTVILEGLTVQRAGELIFDVGSKARDRASSRKSYMRALEDLAFALLFADKTGTTGQFALVGAEKPGELVIMGFPERFVVIGSGESKPDDVMKDPQHRPYLRDIVGRLELAYINAPDAWRDQKVFDKRR